MQPSDISDITEGILSDYMQHASSGATKGFLLLFFFFTYAVLLPKTYKHTVMCKMGGITL